MKSFRAGFIPILSLILVLTICQSGPALSSPVSLDEVIREKRQDVSPSGEPETSAEPETSTVGGAKNDTKSKITETVSKVEGFFKNVGENIKQGVGTAVDKVKTTATNVKDSVIKGINKGADWVKNKTTTEGGQGCKDTNCTMDANSTMSDGDGLTGTEGPDNSTSTGQRRRRSPKDLSTIKEGDVDPETGKMGSDKDKNDKKEDSDPMDSPSKSKKNKRSLGSPISTGEVPMSTSAGNEGGKKA